jgi:hypothetical protein
VFVEQNTSLAGETGIVTSDKLWADLLLHFCTTRNLLLIHIYVCNTRKEKFKWYFDYESNGDLREAFISVTVKERFLNNIPRVVEGIFETSTYAVILYLYLP